MDPVELEAAKWTYTEKKWDLAVAFCALVPVLIAIIRAVFESKAWGKYYNENR